MCVTVQFRSGAYIAGYGSASTLAPAALILAGSVQFDCCGSVPTGALAGGNFLVSSLKCNKSKQTTEVLTDRERQVLQLIAEGHTTKSIASLLFLSVKTSEFHRARIMQRLDIHNIAGLDCYAIRRGMIKA